MSTATMKRWVLRGNGGAPARLDLQSVPIPEPGPGQVRLRVHAAALNSRDLAVRENRYGLPSAPDLVPLSDGAGIIDAVGPDVERWVPGDRVITVYFDGWPDGAPGPQMGQGLGSGAENGVLAEYAILAADRIVRAPASLSLTEAATLPCAALTAWTAIRGNRPYRARELGPDDTVLVLGTGGVSLFTVQLAGLLGARVWVATGSPGKRRQLEKLGVAGVVDHGHAGRWGRDVFDRTGGAQLVVNTVGGGSLDQAIAAVGYDGEIAYLGLFDFAGAAPDLLSLMGKGASIRGVAVGSAAAAGDLVAAVDKHGLEPVIDRVVDFADAPQAYDRHAQRDSFGKIVVEMVAAEETDRG
jgi:NADPH:quinone reductase-like Zn-dependent oxidoreductase